MLAISISAVLLCLVGVWAATMNLNLQGKVSPDIHCKIVANESIIFNNSTEMGGQMTSGNTLSTSVKLGSNSSLTTAVEFELTNFTTDKYIRLSVASISGATIKSGDVAVCQKATKDGDTITPSATQTMTIHIAGASQASATINLKVEEVFKVAVKGTGLALDTNDGDTTYDYFFFAPNDNNNNPQITIEPMIGYQLPTALSIANSSHGEYRTNNQKGVISLNTADIVDNDVVITANCNQIFEIKKSSVASMLTHAQTIITPMYYDIITITSENQSFSNETWTTTSTNITKSTQIRLSGESAPTTTESPTYTYGPNNATRIKNTTSVNTTEITQGKYFELSENPTYLPNNGHYYRAKSVDGEKTYIVLRTTFKEYPYYVEMGMYPQSVVNGTPSVKNTQIYESLASTKTEEKKVITTIDNETNKAVIETTIETTITTNTTTKTSFTFTLTKDKTDEVAGTTTTNTTTETTYWEDATTTDKYAKIVVKDGVGVNATLKSTTYYKFEPIKWIILETTDKTPNDTTDDIALEDLYYKNGMFYTDGACGKPYTGQFVLMSAYVIDGSIFNQQSNNNAVIYAGSTVDNYLNNHLNYNSTGNNGVNMGTIKNQYADNKNLTSVNYTDDDSYNFNNALTTSFFLPGGTKTLNDADTGESYLVHKYFETTGINETSTQSTLNIGVASSTDFAIANGVETNIFAGKSGTESLSAKRGWMLENEDNTPISTSAYWTRSGGGNNGAIAVNMNGIPKNVQITNANIGIRPMMVLDLGFYENGTYTA